MLIFKNAKRKGHPLAIRHIALTTRNVKIVLGENKGKTGRDSLFQKRT